MVVRISFRWSFAFRFLGCVRLQFFNGGGAFRFFQLHKPLSHGSSDFTLRHPTSECLRNLGGCMYRCVYSYVCAFSSPAEAWEVGYWVPAAMLAFRGVL